MSDELARLFQSIRGDTMNSPLAEPGALRGEAERRRRVSRGIAVAAVALVVGLGGGAAYALGRPTAAPPAPPATSPTPSVVPTPSPSGSPAPSPSESESTSAPPRAPGADCRPEDLDPRPWYGAEGAAGSAINWVAVQNVGGTACRLRSPVVIVDVSGTPTPMPTRSVDPAPSPASLLLPPGGYAAFAVRTTNGNPFGAGDPRCAHPADYRHLALRLPGDRLLPLPGFGVSYQCGQPDTNGWRLITDVRTEIPFPRRAP